MSAPSMLERIRSGAGFVAALDQSGGSTPKALAMYGIAEGAYQNDEEMFALMHAMRCRIMTAPAFQAEQVIGAILFEMTMDGQVEGQPVPSYLWQQRGVVPFIKVDKGLEDEQQGVQLLKPMPHLDGLCQRAAQKGVFGTKMRSVIHAANSDGIRAVVRQQFEFAKQILGHGLCPIIEPEINIHAPDKPACEALLRDAVMAELDALASDQNVMLKVTLPDQAGFYAPLVAHARVLRVVALSGGYSRDESNRRLAENKGVIASFSRALTEGLSAQQSDADFNATLAKTIDDIAGASAA